VISYSLICENEHKFDAWFRSGEAYDAQVKRGIVTCPACGSAEVSKALMAPAVTRTPEKMPVSAGHPDQAQLLAAMRELRRKVTSQADYVGDKFAEEARKMHFKEIDARGIYGEATREEVTSLLQEGVEIMPLPALPEEHN